MSSLSFIQYQSRTPVPPKPYSCFRQFPSQWCCHHHWNYFFSLPAPREKTQSMGKILQGQLVEIFEGRLKQCRHWQPSEQLCEGRISHCFVLICDTSPDCFPDVFQPLNMCVMSSSWRCDEALEKISGELVSNPVPFFLKYTVPISLKELDSIHHFWVIGLLTSYELRVYW